MNGKKHTFVPTRTTKPCGGSRGRAPLILNLDSRWKEVEAGT